MDLSNLILTTATLVLLFLVYQLVLKAFIPLLMLKIKFGDQASLCFMPLVGITYLLKRSLVEKNNSHQVLVDIARNQPKVKMILTNMLIWPLILFIDHTYVKKILVDHDQYNKFNIIPETRLIYNGLLFTKGNKWKQQRRQLTRPFTFESLKSRVPLMNQVVKEQMKGITQPFKALEVLTSIAGEILIKSFFGAEMKNLQLNGKSLQLETTEVFGELGLLMKQNILFLMGFSFFGQKIWSIYPGAKTRELHSRVNGVLAFTAQIIQTKLDEKREFYETADKETLTDFLDVFLYEFVHQKPTDPTLSFDDIIQQFLSFFFAGTDTTAHTVSLMLHQLGRDLEGQQELREEVINQIGDGDVQNEDLTQLPKISAFLKECLRVRNPALSLIPRQVVENHYIKDVYVKKGWFVGNNQNVQLSREEYIDNAAVFDWKRWLDKDPVKDVEDQAYVFTPFSAGGRNCIGQHLAQIEVKIIICHFLRTFQISVDPEKITQWSVKFLYGFSPETLVDLKRI